MPHSWLTIEKEQDRPLGTPLKVHCYINALSSETTKINQVTCSSENGAFGQNSGFSYLAFTKMFWHLFFWAQSIRIDETFQGNNGFAYVRPIFRELGVKNMLKMALFDQKITLLLLWADIT